MSKVPDLRKAVGLASVPQRAKAAEANDGISPLLNLVGSGGLALMILFRTRQFGGLMIPRAVNGPDPSTSVKLVALRFQGTPFPRRLVLVVRDPYRMLLKESSCGLSAGKMPQHSLGASEP